jgi:hypothetical protein
MSQVALSGNALGTGTFTIASPNSNTNRTLDLPDTSGTILTNSGSQAASFSALTVNGNNISAVNSLGFRNRIINGNMVIDQRNVGVVQAVSAYSYGLDRWGYQCFGGGVWNSQRTTTVPTGFTNSIGLTVTTADASIGSTDVYQIFQKIEGFNTADLGWGTANAQTITASFWVRSSVTGSYCLGFVNNAFNRTYGTLFSINAANTWEFKTITVPGDTSGTWATDNNIGIQLGIDLGSGSNQNITAGAWATTSNVSTPRTTGSVNWIATNGATFFLTGVQLEAGSVATPFEQRDYGRELFMCQRYYSEVSVTPTTATGFMYVYLPATMRTSPTITLKAGTLNGATYGPAAFSTFQMIRQNAASAGAVDGLLALNAEL